MRRAGMTVGRAILADLPKSFFEHPFPTHLIVLCGKGNNTGDALYAAYAIALEQNVEVTLLLCADRDAWSPSIQRAADTLASEAPCTFMSASDFAQPTRHTEAIEIVIDGIVGMQFRPPLREPVRSLIHKVNQLDGIHARIAIDMPSGINANDADATFRADFTYATGILKTELIESAPEITGRIRYVDIGFFDDAPADSIHRVYSHPAKPAPLRPAACDKRTFGHLLLIAGSRSMPGALLMAAKAAIRSGVGLLTIGAPESICAQLQGIIPEAMWLPWPENDSGGLSLEGTTLIEAHKSRYNAMALGPGMGSAPETKILISTLILGWDKPLLLDADALFPGAVEAVQQSIEKRSATVLTPHAGELARIAHNRTPTRLAEDIHGFVIEKGPRSWVHDAGTSVLVPHGGPVLARGGSGDILAGLVAGFIAATANKIGIETVCAAAAHHGLAADRLCHHSGEQFVQTTDILVHLES